MRFIPRSGCRALVVLDRIWNLWKQRVQPTLGK